jgi:hypothetical protein
MQLRVTLETKVEVEDFPAAAKVYNTFEAISKLIKEEHGYDVKLDMREYRVMTPRKRGTKRTATPTPATDKEEQEA